MQEEVLKTHQLDNIRAVVITGHVPSSAIADVETLARRVAGIEHLEALSGINPALATAHGAAFFALDTQHNPWRYIAQRPDLQEVEEHNEL
jgi:hypothetical protein